MNVNKVLCTIANTKCSYLKYCHYYCHSHHIEEKSFVSQAWWYKPVIPEIGEANAGKLKALKERFLLMT